MRKPALMFLASALFSASALAGTPAGRSVELVPVRDPLAPHVVTLASYCPVDTRSTVAGVVQLVPVQDAYAPHAAVIQGSASELANGSGVTPAIGNC